MQVAPPNPWHVVRDMPHIDIQWVSDLPPKVRSFTDGVARIWIRTGLQQRERRSSLTHELEHIRAGHTYCQPEKIERQIRAQAARWLLPSMPAVMDSVCWHGRICDEAAEDLWVDLITLESRFDLHHMSMYDWNYANRRMAELGHGNLNEES